MELIAQNKSSAKISITCDRDSVCVGDDIDSHKRQIRIQPTHDTALLLERVLAVFTIYNMPNAIWAVWLNDVPIATIATGWVMRYLVPEVSLKDGDKLYFGYYLDDVDDRRLPSVFG